MGNVNYLVEMIRRKEWYSAKEVARLFNVDPHIVSRLCREGKLHCVKFPGIYRIHWRELLKLIT